MRVSKLSAPIIFLLISGLIVATWFKDNIIYGGAEVGLFTYNPKQWLEMSKYVWWGSVAPGQLIPQFITGVPIYFIFSILSLIGLSAQNVQMIFFFLLLFLMGFGIYQLALDIFDEDQKRYSLIAGLFYMFNAYILVQVWHRFLYSTLILAAVLPFLILFWRRWVKNGRVLNLSIFLLINFLAIYMYGNLASIITVWTALTLVTFTEAIFPWQGKAKATTAGFRFLGGLVFWFLLNLWWITPTFSIAPGLLSAQHSSEDNLGTLVVISRQTIMPYLLQLANPFYLFYRQELGEIYSSIIFKVIPWVMSAIIFLGLLASLKSKNFAKYGIIFILALLLAKGAASPFSYPYIFSFKQFYFLGVLRNPFEKFGILLPVFGAILFAIGWQALFKWLKMHLGSALTNTVLILILVTLAGYAWPMIGGRVFGTRQFPVEVKVPESYQQADWWLGQQEKDEGVILHLPFSGRDVVTYQWEKGYHGVDQNEILFTSLPSLSRVVGVKRIDDTLNSLTYIFNPPFSENKENILKILQSFNIKFIVLHKDINWSDKDTYGEKGILLQPDSIEKVLDNLDFLKKQRQFDSLVIYELTGENYQPILIVTDNVQVVYPGKTDIMQILSKTEIEGNVIMPVSDKIDEKISQRTTRTLVFPDKEIEYFESSPSAMIAKANDLFNQLIQMRAYLYSLGNLQSLEIVEDLISSTQKISQIFSVSQISDYEKSIKKMFRGYSEDLNVHRLFSKLIADTLRLHLLILRQTGAGSDITNLIEDDMVKLKLMPKYKTYGQVFKFTVPAEGSFELLLDHPVKEADIKVDGANVSSKSIPLHKGTHEISFDFMGETLKDDPVLKLKGVDESTSSGKVISFKKISPVSYRGEIFLEKGAFVNFAQSYHPGWVLRLTKDGKSYEAKEHFLGNLYGNTWLVDQVGDFDFEIEFTPQKNVKEGIIVAIMVSIALVLANLYTILRGSEKI